MGKEVGTNDHFVVKKETVDFIVVFLVGCIPQPLVAYIVMKSVDEQWGMFWWTMLAMNGFYFVMWFLNFVVTTVAFKLYFRTRAIDDIYNQLLHFKFPTIPKEAIEHSDAESIYYEMANEMEGLPCNIRIRAASFYCDFRNVGPRLISRNRLNKVHIAAFKRYSKDYPNVMYDCTCYDLLVGV